MKGTIKTIDIPLNRVEGDLEIRVEIDDDTVINAWSSGIMYRGFENMLKGRGQLDGLIITPRICGICGTAHLTSAVNALEKISGVKISSNAAIIRNIALMVEHIQSDMRHGFLMYMADFVNCAYSKLSLFEEACKRYEPFKGKTVIDVIRQTKEIIKIIAIIGGQWPHSSYMVPGGIASTPDVDNIRQCRYYLEKYISWYEKVIIGCSLERWLSVKSRTDLENWLIESDSHFNSEVGFYIRYAREIGLNKIGRGHGNFICFGQLELPEESEIISKNAKSNQLIPNGFFRNGQNEEFNHNDITEHIARSWFEGYEGGKHPFEGITNPYASGQESDKYSWIKAPRYKDFPAETGPLAEMIVSENSLFMDFINTDGPNAYVRELARLVRPAELMPAMRKWLMEIDKNKKFYKPVTEFIDGTGYGLTQASRGALGHWIKIKDEKIDHYQIITPTAWNGSPRDSNGVEGPWEKALIGTKIKNIDNPVELGHVIRSFDPCLVCAVHMIGKRKKNWRIL